MHRGLFLIWFLLAWHSAHSLLAPNQTRFSIGGWEPVMARQDHLESKEYNDFFKFCCRDFESDLTLSVLRSFKHLVVQNGGFATACSGSECPALVIDHFTHWVNNQLDSHFPGIADIKPCLLYTSPSPRDRTRSRMPSSA